MGCLPCVGGNVEVDRPQVRTLDGFVLRRTGGYTIYEPALAVENRFQRKVCIEMI
jgi:hypothetical protein